MFSKIPSHVQPYVMREDESAYKAFVKVSISVIYKIVLVVDEDEKLVGVISNSDIKRVGPLLRAVSECEDTTVGDVCSRGFTFLTVGQDKYLYGTRLFVEKTFNEIPIVDNEGIPVEIFGRFQAFFQQYVIEKRHLRLHYAQAIGAAGELAYIKGYNRISVIEFGVATGDGLKLAEIYAEEVSHLFGVSIDVYGFDSGVGLLTLQDYRDLPNFFTSGDYKTDITKLKASLRNARLVIGNICDTAKGFLCGSVAPIGAMLIDVDLYHPTVSILDMLLEDDKNFLPEVYLYFDDLAYNWEFQGEALAIKEFNKKSDNVKIAPELTPCQDRWFERDSSLYMHNIRDSPRGTNRLKVCMRFTHPKFKIEKEPGEFIFAG